MKISGKGYEFISKYVLEPRKKEVEKVDEFSKPIGDVSIDVKYVIYMREAPPDLSLWSSVFVKELAFKAVMNKENWKMPLEGAYRTPSVRTALFLASAIAYYTGGAWVIESNKEYYIWSKGYYHYTGA